MSTLAIMKARIRRDIDREDLDNEMADEISSAIKFYRSRRFYFNEKRLGLTFQTVIGQSEYAETTNALIPHLIDLDEVAIVGDGSLRRLCPIDMGRIDVLLGSTTPAQGRPYGYSYYGQELRLYPRPDKVYTIQISGVFRSPEPATDDETGNPWMTEADELIRARATKRLYDSRMSDYASAQVMEVKELGAFEALVAETSRRSSFRSFRAETL